MQTFDQALLAHVSAGRISMDDALSAASHPHDFKLLVTANQQRGPGEFVSSASRGRV
jgi:twitching motility protein PilT